MIGTPLTSSVDMLLFGALTLWFAIRVRHRARPAGPVSNLLHLAMSGAMARDARVVGGARARQVVVFSAGAFWYAGLALFRPDGGRAPGRRPLSHGTHGGRLWYHAAMMLAMVWMAVAMIPGRPRRRGGRNDDGDGRHAGRTPPAEAMTAGTRPGPSRSPSASGSAFAIATL